MPTPTKGPRLGGGPAHERLILSNLATALFEHGRIRTTEAKAKRLRPLAERLVTFAKRGDLHARRQVLTVVRDKSVVHTLFDEVAPRYADRAGGYTRIIKLGPRKGDNAPMAVIELVEGRTAAQEAVGEAERARSSRFARRRRPTGATAEAAAELASESPTAAAVAAEAEGDESTEATAQVDAVGAVAVDADASGDTEAVDDAADAEAADTEVADAGAETTEADAAVEPAAGEAPTAAAEAVAPESDAAAEASGEDDSASE